MSQVMRRESRGEDGTELVQRRPPDFHDAWARYLPPLLSEEAATSATHATPQVTGSLHVADTKGVADTSATRNGSATDSRPLTCTDADVADVAVSEPSKRGSTDDPLATIRATFPNATPASDDELSLAAEEDFAEEWNDYVYEQAKKRRIR